MTPWTDRAGRFSPLKAATFAGLLLPALWLGYSAWRGFPGAAGGFSLLGPRPITEAIHQTGDWTIRFLLMSLAVTPLRRILQWPKLITVRRMIGLGALSYALGHFCLYVLDQKLDLWRVGSEIALRIYLTIGFAALIGLIALGVTSTDAAIRRLGRNWNRLHAIVYAIGVLAAINFFMQTKADVYEATLIAGLFILMMLYRLAHHHGLPLTSWLALSGLAVAAGLATAAAELAWYGLATGIPPLRVLEANLHFAYQVRPAWWVLAAGLGVALAAAARSATTRDNAPRGRRQPARVAA